MYRIDPRIVFKSMHTFFHAWSKRKKMVMVTVEMPWEVWERVHRLLGVDQDGKVGIPTAQQLRWEQKNRKEIHK